MKSICVTTVLLTLVCLSIGWFLVDLLRQLIRMWGGA